MNFWQTLATNIAVVIPSIIILYVKLKTEIRVSDRYKIELDKRESFRNMLRSHSFLLLKDFSVDLESRKWLEGFSESIINMLLWCSDEVLYEYAMFAKERLDSGKEIIERELHFANSIILFRKELGYKNKDDKISPENIVKIFRIGFDKYI
ncbi:MAG: hypothetical protein KAW56_17120 [Candidatus Marinimicrobia bacterium]|nr:hypothetical protein [Candidatus Neomarinimicrobiota bacterium]